MSIEKDIMSSGACDFVADLARKFSSRLDALLKERTARQKLYDKGRLPNFSEETSHIRNSNWKVAPVPDEIQDRRVEITGPPERKMVINALNSGANVFMADFEDSLSPTWVNVVHGQKNLHDALRGTISYMHPKKGIYKLNENPATLFVRPRGLHLTESNFNVDGKRCPASLFDFGLYMFHNAKWLHENGKKIYLYLPKLEHHKESQWWNDVFQYAQDQLKIPQGTIKATVLLETLPAAFQMHEILWTLRDHSAGLNCGRWDYIFSYIKTFRNSPERVTPDRSEIGMTSSFMDAYSKTVIHVCHKRGAHAMGGMAAQIPIKDDPRASEKALEKVRKDKLREVLNGHDGTWVAHPGLVSLAREVFDEHMPEKNQIEKLTTYQASQEDLLHPPTGDITLEGLTQNVDVCIKYLSAWLSGNGCVPLYNLMEDAATAEISRAQVWQWLKHKAETSKGKKITLGLVGAIAARLAEEDASLIDACDLFLEFCEKKELENFLTLTAYERLQ